MDYDPPDPSVLNSRLFASECSNPTAARLQSLEGLTWARRDRKTEICPEVFGWSISQKTFTAGAVKSRGELLYRLLPLWRIGSLIFLRTEVANAMELECRNFKGLDVRLKPTEFDVSQQVRRWSFCCYFHDSGSPRANICPETSGIQKPNVTKHLLCLQLRLIVMFFVSYDIN